jgi:hypothetical protein
MVGRERRWQQHCSNVSTAPSGENTNRTHSLSLSYDSCTCPLPMIIAADQRPVRARNAPTLRVCASRNSLCTDVTLADNTRRRFPATRLASTNSCATAAATVRHSALTWRQRRLAIGRQRRAGVDRRRLRVASSANGRSRHARADASQRIDGKRARRRWEECPAHRCHGRVEQRC